MSISNSTRQNLTNAVKSEATFENEDLKVKVEETEKEMESLRDHIVNLDKKLKKAEKDLHEQSIRNKKILDEKNEEIKLLKSVIKGHSDEMNKQKSENKENLKLFKSKEKEIHNLEKKDRKSIANHSEPKKGKNLTKE